MVGANLYEPTNASPLLKQELLLSSYGFGKLWLRGARMHKLKRVEAWVADRLPNRYPVYEPPLPTPPPSVNGGEICR